MNALRPRLDEQFFDAQVGVLDVPAPLDRRDERDHLELLMRQLQLVVVQQKLTSPARLLDKVNNAALVREQQRITQETVKIAKDLEKQVARNKELVPAEKTLSAAVKHFQKLEQAVEKKDKERAAAEQEAALKQVEAAREIVERAFERCRLYELKRRLDVLRQQSEAMATKQKYVLEATAVLAKGIAAANQKPTAAHKTTAAKLADLERKILTEATAAIKFLKEESVTGAVPEAFLQLREDVKSVEARLQAVDVGNVTQAIQRDIVDALKEMSDALRKARKDLDEPKKKTK